MDNTDYQDFHEQTVNRANNVKAYIHDVAAIFGGEHD